jgi:hypothetical protein
LAIVGGLSHRSTRQYREQYEEVKKEFTKIDVPSQYASFYEAGGAGILHQVSDQQIAFGYSLWNFALGMYGKLGGMAWVIPQRLAPNDDRVIDLSIGLRFVRADTGTRDSRFYVGHATIIDKFGRWVETVSSKPFEIDQSLRSMVVPREQMSSLVGSAIDQAVQAKKTKQLLESKSEVSISIFRLDDFNDEEVMGIRDALQKRLGSKETKLGLLSVVSEPTVMLQQVPKRGTAIRLNPKTCIIYTSGKRGGLPIYPIVVTAENLDSPESPFQSLDEVANHIMSTSSLHWQTIITGSSKLPAPLSFAQSIASLSSIGAEPSPNSWLRDTLWFI